MRAWQILYWLIGGVLMGFGIIGILSIGFPFLLLGIGLVAFGIARFWIRDLWAAVMGFGAAPALILWHAIVTAPPPCPPGGLVVHGGTASCGYMPPSYTEMAIFFGAVALAGALWPLLAWSLHRRRHAHA